MLNYALAFFEFETRDILIWLVLFGGLSVAYMLFMPQIMGIQSKLAIRGAKKSLDKLQNWSEQSKREALKELGEYGRTPRDIKGEFDDFLEFFTIEPVSEDPRGVLDRLEHLIDVRKKRYEDTVERFAPEAEEEEAANLEMAMEGALANYTIYKIVRHFIRIAEKTGSMQIAQLLQMQMPILESIAEAYHDATEAFTEGKIIGDGIGPMIASKIIEDAEAEEKIKDTVYAKTKIEDREAYVVKAKGPGGRVGKPGELIREVGKETDIDRIIMIDAGLKLEGERSGKIVEGVGAAIGGPPTEKHKIEELTTEKDIPLDAIVIKQSLKEAITPMSKQLSDSVDPAVERVKKAIQERTEEDETIVIAGIGNTIGVGQDPENLPKEFPVIEKDESELESFLPLPGIGGAAKPTEDTLNTKEY
ncbi:MAG: DUF1512 family protein [Candidatus Hadarchaeota archaeon]